MKTTVKTICAELEQICNAAYEQGVTLEDAEKLAARSLQAQMLIANELSTIDLDSRMKKNGVKAVKAAVYLDEVGKYDKKPSDTLLENTVACNKLVLGEQERYDQAEALRDSLLIYLGIFKDAHIYFRGIAKGRFE